MKCIYCLEPMNDGAVVCKTCGRKQPLVGEARTERLMASVAIVFGIGLATLFAYGLYDHFAREQAVDRLTACARVHGNKVDSSYVDFDLDEDSNGQGWRTGERVLKFEYGCSY